MKRASAGGLPAVDVEDMAGDVGSLVRRDEYDRVCKLLREAEATHRNTRRESSLVLLRACKTGQHASVGGARRHAIHADSRLGDLERHRLGDALDGVLAADIDRGPGRTLVPVGRGDVDNATAALSLHDAHFVLHAQDHAENIGVERRGIAFGRLVRDRADLSFGAGIVHRDVETAKPCDGLVDHGADVFFLADVGVDELGLRPERAQLVDERLAGLIAPTGNDHLRALPGESDGGGPPDAGQPTCNQNNGVAHGTSPSRYGIDARQKPCGGKCWIVSGYDVGSAGAAEKDFVGWSPYLQSMVSPWSCAI